MRLNLCVTVFLISAISCWRNQSGIKLNAKPTQSYSAYGSRGRSSIQIGKGFGLKDVSTTTMSTTAEETPVYVTKPQIRSYRNTFNLTIGIVLPFKNFGTRDYTKALTMAIAALKKKDHEKQFKMNFRIDMLNLMAPSPIPVIREKLRRLQHRRHISDNDGQKKITAESDGEKNNCSLLTDRVNAFGKSTKDVKSKLVDDRSPLMPNGSATVVHTVQQRPSRPKRTYIAFKAVSKKRKPRKKAPAIISVAATTTHRQTAQDIVPTFVEDVKRAIVVDDDDNEGDDDDNNDVSDDSSRAETSNAEAKQQPQTAAAAAIQKKKLEKKVDTTGSKKKFFDKMKRLRGIDNVIQKRSSGLKFTSAMHRSSRPPMPTSVDVSAPAGVRAPRSTSPKLRAAGGSGSGNNNKSSGSDSAKNTSRSMFKPAKRLLSLKQRIANISSSSEK